MKAAFANSHHIMTALIQRGANVDLTANNGSTALMIAAMANNLKIVEYLYEFGRANVDIRNVDGMTAAMLAAENGCYMVVTYLAKVGANVFNVKDNKGRTLFDVVDKTSGQSHEVTRKRLEQAVAKGLKAAKTSEAAEGAKDGEGEAGAAAGESAEAPKAEA